MAQQPSLLLRIFLFWQEVRLKYERVKGGENSENNTSLGVQSLTMSILGTVLTVGLAFLAYKCLFSLGGSGLGELFVLIGGILSAVVALASFVYLNLASLLYARYQCKLNKKPIGKAALIVSIVSIVLSLGGVVLVLALIASGAKD